MRDQYVDDSERLAETIRPLFAEFDRKLGQIRETAIQLAEEIDSLEFEEVKIEEELQQIQTSPTRDNTLTARLHRALIKNQTKQHRIRERRTALSGLAASQRRTIEAFIRQVSQRIEHTAVNDVTQIELSARLGSLENELQATTSTLLAAGR